LVTVCFWWVYRLPLGECQLRLAATYSHTYQYTAPHIIPDGDSNIYSDPDANRNGNCHVYTHADHDFYPYSHADATAAGCERAGSL
jgi:hypothetical protein